MSYISERCRWTVVDEEGKGWTGVGRGRVSGGWSGPFVLSITLPASDYRSDTFRVTPATPSPSSLSSLLPWKTGSLPLLPPRHLFSVHRARRLLPTNPTSNHSNTIHSRGREGGGRGLHMYVCVLKSGELVWPVSIKFRAGLRKGEEEGRKIIQGRRWNRDKTSFIISTMQSFLYSFSLSAIVLFYISFIFNPFVIIWQFTRKRERRRKRRRERESEGNMYVCM